MDSHNRWRLVALTLAFLLLAMSNLAVWLLAKSTRDGSESAGASARWEVAPATASVQRRVLVETLLLPCRFDAADTFRHILAEAEPLLGAPVVTSVAVSAGDVLKAGDMPLTVSGRPLVLLPKAWLWPSTPPTV